MREFVLGGFFVPLALPVGHVWSGSWMAPWILGGGAWLWRGPEGEARSGAVINWKPYEYGEEN